jgi:hypothetical protein
MRKAICILSALGALVFASSSVEAAPASTTCTGPHVGGIYFGVIVPAGATCSFANALVIGNINVGAGAGLVVFSIGGTTKVVGDITGVGSAYVQVVRSTVIGSVSITAENAGASGVGAALVEDSTVLGGNVNVSQNVGNISVAGNVVGGGSISVSNNEIPPFTTFPHELDVSGNDVAGGDVTVSHNTGSGPKTVTENHVLGTLSCEQNDAPFVGSPNTALRIVGDCS